MPMRDSDTILGATRGSADEALAFARNVGAKRLDHVERYVQEVYQLAPKVGIDPAIVVVQSALETNNWRDEKWNRKLNAAGIGVTDDLDHGFGWDNGESSARGHIVHLWLYTKGTTLPDALADHKALDPRWDAAVAAGYASGSPTLAKLSGRWASVPDYGRRIANRAPDVFPNLPDQGKESSMATSHESIAASAPPALPIVRNFIPENNRNRYHDKFPAGDLPITVHETNNPGTDALREGGFFRGGGGEHVVAVHFVVDDQRAVQLLPLDERGKHCGSAVGDKTSVAIETCVKTGMDFKKVRRNLAQLIALIVTGNEAIDWGDGSSRGRFSIDRVKMHNDWSPANPCPRHIRAEGYFPTLIQAVREIAQNVPSLPPRDERYVKPHDPPPFDGTDKTVNGNVFHPFKKQVTSKGVNRREWADPDSKKTGPEIPEGEKIKVLYWVEGKAVSGNNVWLIGESGSRIWSGGVKEPVP